jgi:hypothetical protein
VSWKTLGAQISTGTPVVIPVATTTSFFSRVGTATCPTGTFAISGGESFSDSGEIVMQSVQVASGTGPSGWTVTGGNLDTTAPVTMTVYAICINTDS